MSIRSAKTVRVNLIWLCKAAEALYFLGQRVEPLGDVRESSGLLIHHRVHYGFDCAALQLQHQLLGPGQLGLDKLELVIRQSRTAGRSGTCRQDSSPR